MSQPFWATIFAGLVIALLGGCQGPDIDAAKSEDRQIRRSSAGTMTESLQPMVDPEPRTPTESVRQETTPPFELIASKRDLSAMRSDSSATSPDLDFEISAPYGIAILYNYCLQPWNEHGEQNRFPHVSLNLNRWNGSDWTHITAVPLVEEVAGANMTWVRVPSPGRYRLSSNPMQDPFQIEVYAVTRQGGESEIPPYQWDANEIRSYIRRRSDYLSEKRIRDLEDSVARLEAERRMRQEAARRLEQRLRSR